MELKLHPQASLPQHRELRAFVRHYIDLIERAVGQPMHWTVTIAPTAICYACEITVERAGIVIRATGDGFDGAVAGRNAFIKLHELLRAHDVEVARVVIG